MEVVWALYGAFQGMKFSCYSSYEHFFKIPSVLRESTSFFKNVAYRPTPSVQPTRRKAKLHGQRSLRNHTSQPSCYATRNPSNLNEKNGPTVDKSTSLRQITSTWTMCVSNKHRPWTETSFRVARPLVKDLRRNCVAHLTGTFMRIHGKCQYPMDVAMKLAEVAREARYGAGFTRSLVAKAVDSFSTHA